MKAQYTVHHQRDVESLSSVNSTPLLTQHRPILHPILALSRSGHTKKLQELLKEKSLICKTKHPVHYPKDFKYNFMNLLEKDEDGRTALHLATSVANEEMSLETIQIILCSPQVRLPETLLDGKIIEGVEKLDKVVNCRDGNYEIPLIKAILYKYTKVVSYLLDHHSEVYAKDVHGTEILKLIYQNVPEVLKDNYDHSIKLTDDFKSLSLNLQTVIGYGSFHLLHKSQKKPPRIGYELPSPVLAASEKEIIREEGCFRKETEYLIYALTPNNLGDQILFHPLIKLFLHLKWQKIRMFFVGAFIFQLVLLGLYATGFVLLQIESRFSLDSIDDEDVAVTKANIIGPKDRFYGSQFLWNIVFIMTILVAIKELAQFRVLGKSYWTMDNAVQISFIVLFVIQFCYLVAGDLRTAATLSIIGVFLATVLTIFLVGKTQTFGAQVAAVQKVIHTCSPHFPLLSIWFIGFGLIFWALFYKNEDLSALGIPARVAAMGIGELNANEMLDKFLGGHASLKDFVCVMCFLFFIVFVVTLHFNLLVGYAVNDIQQLNKEAAVLELYNHLSTIYTIESFVLAAAQLFGRPEFFNSFYILPPSLFEIQKGKAFITFDEVPTDILNECKEIAFMNLKKKQMLM